MAGHSEGLMYGELKHITSTAASLGGAVLGMPTLRHRGPILDSGKLMIVPRLAALVNSCEHPPTVPVVCWSRIGDTDNMRKCLAGWTSNSVAHLQH